MQPSHQWENTEDYSDEGGSQIAVPPPSDNSDLDDPPLQAEESDGENRRGIDQTPDSNADATRTWSGGDTEEITGDRAMNGVLVGNGGEQQNERPPALFTVQTCIITSHRPDSG
jgi:hypothetical protein